MHPTIEQLLKHKPVVLDGAWGTQLQAQGLPIGANPDVWNLEHPERVEAVARGYVEAGSEIILTNSFGANRYILERHGLAEKVAEINRAGAEISKRACGGKALVFGSMGPTGKILMMGDVTVEDMQEVFREQAQALADGGADGLLIETMSDLEEVKVAVAAARTTGLPVAVSLVYDAGAEKDRTMMGVTPERAAEELADSGIDVLGANCGQGIAGFVKICQRLHQASHLPVWIKANAGLPEMVDGKAVYRTSPAEFASHVEALVQAGASFIGGCCGTSPDYIRALKQVLGARE